ncbi:MAG: hypothetical protein WD053_11450 [Gracilimonas sp.]
MISEQIIEEYLEQETNTSHKVAKLKITLLIISFAGLLMFSL